MKTIGYLALLVGMLSLVLGVGSQLSFVSIAGMEGHALLQYAQTCFLLSIAITLGPKVK
jgi:hypothetical protein